MKILLTGATGFIGKHLLINLLNSSNVEIVCLARDPASLRHLQDVRKFEVLKGDILDVNSINKAVAGVEVVYHLAGSVHENDPKKLYLQNVQGSLNVFGAALKGHVGAFVYLSSLAAVGPSSGNDTINEVSTPEPITEYGRSKLMAEEGIALRMQQEKSKIFLAIVRPPVVYGPGMNLASRFIDMVMRILRKRFLFLGNENNIISLSYLPNLVNFLLIFLKRNPSGAVEKFVIRDNDTHSLKQIVEIAAAALETDVPKTRIDPKIVSLCNYLIRTVEQKFRLNSIFFERFKEITSNWNVSNSKAIEWGYRELIPQTHALKATIAWCRQQIDQ